MLAKDSFPPGILFAFAYGSAAFPQSSCPQDRRQEGSRIKQTPHQPDDRMMDLVFVVSDSLSWHRDNLSLNPSHYSFLGSAGAELILLIQRKVKAFIYFNVVMDMGADKRGIHHPAASRSLSSSSSTTTAAAGAATGAQVGQQEPAYQSADMHGTVMSSMKYGVIQYEDLMRDLMGWDCLYVAGRLHKPIHVILHAPDQDYQHDLNRALSFNRTAAAAASLLLMPATAACFTEDQLFNTIAGLSYYGDFRMIIGEDREKVAKIVRPQKHHFRQIYLPIVQDLLQHEVYEYDELSATFHIPFTVSLIMLLICRLPRNVIQQLGGIEQLSVPLFATRKQAPELRDREAIQMISEMRQQLSYNLKKCITSIVWRSSLCQGIKGFFTTGFLKAVKYMCRKMRKMYASIGNGNGTAAAAAAAVTTASMNGCSSAAILACNNNQSNGRIVTDQ